jgi:hypothetical protein
VIHIISRTFFRSQNGIPDIPLKKLINLVPNLDLNVLSKSGSTAFYYCLNWVNLNGAKFLIDKGANPRLYKKKNRNPIKLINEYIKSSKEMLRDKKFKNKHSSIKTNLKIILDIKSKI